MSTPERVRCNLRDGFANHILIDCNRKKFLFPSLEEVKLVSSRQIIKEVKKGSLFFVILTHLVVEEGEKKTKILIMKEFVYVFPNKVSGLPLKRDVKFSIDLVPRVG